MKSSAYAVPGGLPGDGDSSSSDGEEELPPMDAEAVLRAFDEAERK